ncbi:alpha/beta hydrolase [Paractinoplanes toevensis]|uniref:Alpha/beta hydrolase n=1 Tax=Paractinoplanes toevensis TaxID=571911 RepID=A0A919TGT2_9ACTN|nr:alpha/beta hydrolase [Actinoplanes toevensis]GIM93839.1 alpha/beta hydrolase [Actinoplanes toevensis]
MSHSIGIRLLHALRKQPDWLAMSAAELDAYREAENRKRASRAMRLVTGFPRRGVTIGWHHELPVRVYRDAGPSLAKPLVLHVHGGGFVGTAAQSDWINSHLAGRLGAVVVSVEHRLLAPGTPLSAAVDDGWQTLRHVVDHAAEWGIDPDRVAVLGESAGAVVAALAAIRAHDSGLRLRAQVLVNPCVDVTTTAFDHPSMAAYPDDLALLELFCRLAVPDGHDARAVSPLYADDLGGLAPALVVVPTADPLADHGRTYAERLRAAGTPARVTEHPGAPHAFLSMPGLVPRRARAARAEIVEFLRDQAAIGVPASSSENFSGDTGRAK